MLTPDEALTRILALGSPLATETLPLAEAAGRWLAEEVTARRTQPARDLSAMDGYAVRQIDGDGPWKVVGQSAAGLPFVGEVTAGEAVRIFTGAALPRGTDAIVIQEEVTRHGDRLTASNAGVVKVSWVRRAGSDFAAGQSLLRSGDALTPAATALAAAGGHGTLTVRRPVRVALVSTGDELVAPGDDAGTDRLPASNGLMLAAMLRGLPVEIVDLGLVRDDLSAMTDAFARASGYDLVVTSGGASVGDHDLVRPALIAAGGDIDFWRIAMRPGKPLLAGTLGDAVVVGLPGNPVSAFVTAILFVLPLVRHLSGARDPAPCRFWAELDEALPAVGARTDYVRARWVDGRLAPFASGDSSALVPLVAADALIVRPAGAAALPEGTRVEAIALA